MSVRWQPLLDFWMCRRGLLLTPTNPEFDCSKLSVDESAINEREEARCNPPEILKSHTNIRIKQNPNKSNLFSLSTASVAHQTL